MNTKTHIKPNADHKPHKPVELQSVRKQLLEMIVRKEAERKEKSEKPR